MAMQTEVYVDLSVTGGGAATSTQSAGAGANTAYSGGSVDWSNPGNITSSNNSYATAVFMFAGTPTKYLEATDFGFSIPAGATIDGIECFIERKYGTAAVRDTKVYIRNGDGSGGIGSTNKADTGSDWPSSDGTATYGSSSDAWGETWTVAKINSSDFGVVLACQLTGFSMTGGEAYVDHISIKVYYTTASGDTGDGSSGDPYNSLRYAFAQEGNPSNYTRYNVKSSTYLDPSNDNGTLPTPSNNSKTITIAPYSSSAGDTRGPLYISGSGHQIWNQNTTDHFIFADCHFFDYGTGYAFDLDNYISCIRCTFDPSGVAPACDWDADSLFHNCHFKKVTGKLNSRGENIWDFNTVDWIADSDSGHNDWAMNGQVIFQNRIFCSGSTDEVISTSYSYGSLIHANTIKMSRGSQDDCGILGQTGSMIEFNHIEGGQTAINNYGRGGLVQNNSFYDNTGDINLRSTAIHLASGNALYSQSLTATAVAGVEFVTNGGSGLNFTPSTELINLYNQSSKSQDWSGSGTGINHQWGAVLNYPASTDGLSYSKEMRTVD